MATMRVRIVDLEQLVRAAKRISHAAGYLELGLIPQALDQLEEVKDFGPFDAAADLIRGEAYRCQQRHEDAAKWFRQAARKFANPFNQMALIAVSQCLQAALQGMGGCPSPCRGGIPPNRIRPNPPPPERSRNL